MKGSKLYIKIFRFRRLVDRFRLKAIVQLENNARQGHMIGYKKPCILNKNLSPVSYDTISSVDKEAFICYAKIEGFILSKKDGLYDTGKFFTSNDLQNLDIERFD